MSSVPRLHDKINVLILMQQFQVCLLERDDVIRVDKTTCAPFAVPILL